MHDPEALGAERPPEEQVLGAPRAVVPDPQSIARIDCTSRKALIYRGIVRAVLSQGIDRQWTVTDRSHMYRPRIGRLRIYCFAGLLCTFS